jgi:hypothetical protein
MAKRGEETKNRTADPDHQMGDRNKVCRPGCDDTWFFYRPHSRDPLMSGRSSWLEEFTQQEKKYDPSKDHHHRMVRPEVTNGGQDWLHA